MIVENYYVHFTFSVKGIYLQGLILAYKFSQRDLVWRSISGIQFLKKHTAAWKEIFTLKAGIHMKLKFTEIY